MEKELDFLGRALNNPERPFVAILGGAKVSDKIPVIESLIERKVDKLLIGGAMAYTFFKANGFTVGKSLVEDEMMPKALEIEQKAAEAGVELLLPTDHQVVDSYDPLHSAKSIPVAFTTPASSASTSDRRQSRSSAEHWKRQDHRVERADGNVRRETIRRRYRGDRERSCRRDGERQRRSSEAGTRCRPSIRRDLKTRYLTSLPAAVPRSNSWPATCCQGLLR